MCVLLPHCGCEVLKIDYYIQNKTMNYKAIVSFNPVKLFGVVMPRGLLKGRLAVKQAGSDSNLF